MSSKAYRATRVNEVNWEQLARGKEGLGVTLGIDVGKFDLWVICRWADGRFERPWRVKNPWEIPTLVGVLKQVKADRKLVVALEPSGTYGEALRQALGDNGIEVQRVGTKASHDYAEIFDGVPSQHDGKDAAVVAELAELGKAKPWAYEAADSWEEELAYWVEEMVAQRQMLMPWQGRLEGLLARHWPEASQVLKLSSGTLLRIMKRYGSPQALAADGDAATQLARWGRSLLSSAKIEELLTGAQVECRRSPRSLAAASDPGVRRAGAGRPAAGESGATAVASIGRGASGAPGARQGGGCADGVCLVGEHG